MRTSKEMADEVWRRVDEAERRKAVQKRKIYSVIAVTACFAVVLVLSLVMPYYPANGMASNAGQYTATLFSGGMVGGYVLIAVVAFVLGAAAALFCVKMLKRK